jgi:hypothetical protein
LTYSSKPKCNGEEEIDRPAIFKTLGAIPGKHIQIHAGGFVGNAVAKRETHQGIGSKAGRMV